MKYPRPRLGVSKCLEFEACRYNGVMISNADIDGFVFKSKSPFCGLKGVKR